MPETDVDSFILRFVQVRDAAMPDASLPDAGMRDATMRSAQEQGPDKEPTTVPWHGVIRHVQSKEEIRFTQIEDALRFVANYVALDAAEPRQDNTD